MQEIDAEVRYTRRMTGRGALTAQVLAAVREVPRDEFVPSNLAERAYDNRPLPIGDGQTISQPYMVALMTDLLEPQPDHVVLEVGTGSGYQAAVLSRLVQQVYSMEIIPTLAEQARTRLHQLGYDNVSVRVGDGYQGWPEHAPYDSIIVTAAAPHVPPPLINQLKPGGRLVVPVGPSHYGQQLMLLTKAEDGSNETRVVIPVAFVPLTGDHDAN
ncbi:MAG: protein-L-isoaspartate(D-aspartate) O-methyltransferase [Gammaproteobacteria bacterium]